MQNLILYLFLVLPSTLATQQQEVPPPPPPSFSVVVAGTVSSGKYNNRFFGLTVDAPGAEVSILPVVNNSGKRARLVEILSRSAKWDEKYTFAVLADALSMNPQLQSPTQYVRSVRHALEKDGFSSVHEEALVEISGVQFTGATLLEPTTEGRKYFRGIYATFRFGYVLSFDAEASSETRLKELVTTLVQFE